MSDYQQEMFKIFKESYSKLHHELVTFAEELPSKLEENAPAELQNVRVLPTYMNPSDSDFTVDDAITVLEKWKFIEDAIDSVLQNISFYVVDKGWYEEQQPKMGFHIQLVKNSSNFLKKETPKFGQVVEIPSGIGGVNWYNTDIKKRLDTKAKEEAIRSLISALNSVRT